MPQRELIAKFKGFCWVCEKPIEVGERMIWTHRDRPVRHAACEVRGAIATRLPPFTTEGETLE